MYVFQNLLNLFIPSASGQAATSLPIPAHGDMAGITRQTTCIIFQIGNGLSNNIIPTAALMAPFPWPRSPTASGPSGLPLLGLQFVAGAILVLIANAIHLGPCDQKEGIW